MKPEVFTNARGETVMTLRFFKASNFGEVVRSTQRPYPKHRRRGAKR